MPLRRLSEVYDRLDGIDPPHHRRRPVPWLIALAVDGRFLGFVATRGDDGQGKEYVTPYCRRSGTRPSPFLLTDVPAAVLGLGLDKLTPEKAAERHADFRELVDRCAAACDNLEVRAVVTFLRDHLEAARQAVPEMIKPGDLLTFQVGERLVTDLPEVRAFWQQCQTPTESGEGLEAECLLCGKVGPVVQSHPVELHLGADRVQFVTANENAFESYGLNRSEIAPVCTPCALRYGQAADHLMTSRDHHASLGGLHYVYWTRRGGSGSIMALFEEPQPEEVKRLLDRVYAPGQRVPIEDEAFYVLAATANQSRLIVRDWLETTLGKAEANLARYFALQALVGNDGAAGDPLGVRSLLGSLVRNFDDLSPHALPALLGAALRGRPLPIWLLHQAVRRAHGDTDHRVTRPRAMLVKMVLNSLPEAERRLPVIDEALDQDNHHPAYLCGRLFALLEAAQRRAIPGINATVADRFFATASSAPASVFPRLMRGAKTHLSKLTGTESTRGAGIAIERKIEDLCADLTAFPTVLSLTDQGLFLLGYYHQRAADRAAAGEYRERRAETASEGASDHE